MAKKFRTDEIPVGKFTEDWGGNKNNTIPAAPDETNLLPYSGEAVQKDVYKRQMREFGKWIKAKKCR